MIFSRSAHLLGEPSVPLQHFVSPCMLWESSCQGLQYYRIMSPFHYYHRRFRASGRKGHSIFTLAELFSEGLKRWGMVGDAKSVHLTCEYALARQLGNKGLQLLSRACTAGACSLEAHMP